MLILKIGVPPLISEERLKPGSFLARHADDVVVVNFEDKKPVRAISTYHNMNQTLMIEKPGRPVQYKLDLITDYNAGMGGVDQKDAMLQAHLVERKQCVKWYKKMFKRLLNVSLLNARILVERYKNVKLNNTAFRLQLVCEIMSNHLAHKPHPQPEQQSTFSHLLDPGRVICEPEKFHSIRKFLKETVELDAPRTAGTSSINKRKCVYCRPNPRQTVYECSICKVPLCIEPSFESYHTRR